MATTLERFNCTLRQRASRLVRKALSFSKKLANHISAIKLFTCDYNATLNAVRSGHSSIIISKREFTK